MDYLDLNILYEYFSKKFFDVWIFCNKIMVFHSKSSQNGFVLCSK